MGQDEDKLKALLDEAKDLTERLRKLHERIDAIHQVLREKPAPDPAKKDPPENSN